MSSTATTAMISRRRIDGDTLKGGKGNDLLNAGPVDDDNGDSMSGGAGDDVLTGQEGRRHPQGREGQRFPLGRQ
jgi:Ca2+-binding RTX toxin-like protein